MMLLHWGEHTVNANELADEVEMWGRDLLALNMKGGVPVIEGARLIRQQQAEIETLKTCLIVEQEHNERMIENQSHHEGIAHVGGFEAGYQAAKAKTLTDEEIDDVLYSMDWAHDPVDFAKAILRKAQEK